MRNKELHFGVITEYNHGFLSVQHWIVPVTLISVAVEPYMNCLALQIKFAGMSNMILHLQSDWKINVSTFNTQLQICQLYSHNHNHHSDVSQYVCFISTYIFWVDM